METILKKENKLVFKDTMNESLANAIRRYLNQVPILAVDEVEISKNDSPLYDETVAHRIGLVPLKMDKSFNEKTEVVLKLAHKKEGFVQSEELKGKAEVVYKNIPITSLSKGQELELKATAKLGIGFDHAKFSPGLMFYRTVSEVTLDKDLAEEVKRVCRGSEIKEKGDKIIVKDDQEKEISDVCEGISEQKGKQVETSPTGELVVTIESFGQLEVVDIFKKSIEVLKKDLKDVSKKIK